MEEEIGMNKAWLLVPAVMLICTAVFATNNTNLNANNVLWYEDDDVYHALVGASRMRSSIH